MTPTLYKCISVGLNKRQLVPLTSDIQPIIDKNPNADFYESLYVYSDEHKQQFDKTKSLAGITGITTNRLIFDFDSASDTELARTDAKELCSRLIGKGVPADQIQIYFSGNKGYHVELKTTDIFTRKELENTVRNLGEGLETLDTRITDEQRIIRISMTKHPKTGLYKIPLTVDELTDMPLDVIKDLAANPPDDSKQLIETWKQIELPVTIKSLKNLSKKEKEHLDEFLPLEEAPNFANKPKHLTAAKYALQEGFFDAGERHAAYMILASTYRNQGYNKELAYNMLKATNRLQSRRTGQEPFSTDELWMNIVQYVYSPKWRGGMYSENEDQLLQKTVAKFDLKNDAEAETILMDVSKVDDLFKNFAENIDKNTIKLGIPRIDEEVRVTTSMMVCLLAAPSAGKSSVSFGILNAVSQSSIKSLFFSLDMGAPLVYQRLIQRHTGLSGDVIFEKYKGGDATIAKYKDLLVDQYKHVKFCFRSGITTDDIRKTIRDQIQLEGEAPKLVVIDYLECIQGPYSDPTANKAIIATQLKDIANEFGICVFLLVQPQKSAGDPSYELNSYRKIKGSSVIEEAASVIFTMYRPGFSPKNPKQDKFLTLNVVKNRMGVLGSYDFHWNGVTGEIAELNDIEREELDQLRSSLAMERAKDELF